MLLHAGVAGQPTTNVPTPRRPSRSPFRILDRWAAGNAGIPYVWTFAGPAAGPHVLVQALTHGNEVCGAIALDWLLAEDFRPTRGTLSLCFANVAAYESFDRADPFASRCVDEDFNRLWTAEVLDGPRQTADLARARALRPLYDRVDYLLDLHSMTDRCPPLAMAGRQRKGVELAQALGSPEHIIVDGGHAAGKRLRDYAFFDDSGDPRNALLIECGQHWEAGAPDVAKQVTLRFLRHFGMCEPRVPRCPSRARADAGTEGDRGHGDGDDRDRRLRVRRAGRRARRRAEGRHAARARRRRRDRHALRRLRADHADAPPEEGRDRGAPGALRAPEAVATAMAPA